MKRILITLFLLSGFVTLKAQYEGTQWQDRIGHAKDSVENRKRFSAFNDDMQSQNWTLESYKAWRYLFDNAPYCDNFLYNEANGGMKMLQSLIKEEKDPAIRAIYFQDAMEAYDFRLKNLKALNSIVDKRFQRSEGEMMAWKAHFYLQMKDYIPAPIFSYQENRDLFAKAIKFVSEQKGGIGDEFQANAFLPEYFESCLNLYSHQGGDAYETFLTDYETCNEICQGMVDVANEETDSVKKQAIFNRFYAPKLRIDSLYAASGLGTTDSLEAYYSAKLSANRKNKEFLAKAVHNMFYHSIWLPVRMTGKPNKTGTFYSYCEADYMNSPSYENCIGMGYAAREDDLPREEWVNQFGEAVKNAETEAAKGFVHKLIATELNYFWKENPKFDTDGNGKMTVSENELWQGDLMVADINYENAANELALAYEKAACYYNRAIVQYYMQQYDQAEESLNKAQQTDILYASMQGGVIESIKAARKAKQEREAKAAKNAAAKKANDAANAEAWRKYNEYLQKKAAEEAFWKGGH